MYTAAGAFTRFIASDGTCQRWSLSGHSASPELICKTPKGCSDIAVSALGAIAIASDDTFVYLILPSTPLPAKHGEAVIRLEGHRNYVFCVKFNAAGNVLASGSYDESVCIWDARSGRRSSSPILGACLKTLSAHAEPVTSLDFSPDSTLLATASYDGLIGQCVKTVADDDISPVSHVSFTPNGKFLLAATLDGIIRLWSIVATGAKASVVKTYAGHRSVKYCTPARLHVTGGEQVFIVSGSEDGALFVWNSNTRQVAAQTDCWAGTPIIGCDVQDNLVAVSALQPVADIKVYRICHQ